MYFLRATRPSTILSISGCISGSPPGIETIGRAAFIDRPEALLGRHVHLENMSGILNLAAARAGQIAAEQRLEHQHERIPLVPGRALAQHITHDRPHLRDRVHPYGTYRYCRIDSMMAPAFVASVWLSQCCAARAFCACRPPAGGRSCRPHRPWPREIFRRRSPAWWTRSHLRRVSTSRIEADASWRRSLIWLDSLSVIPMPAVLVRMNVPISYITVHELPDPRWHAGRSNRSDGVFVGEDLVVRRAAKRRRRPDPDFR